MRLLLHLGSDINVQCQPHGTALQAASSACSEKVAPVLLGHGADIRARARNSVSEDGDALQVASVNSHETIVRLLLDRGADANTLNGCSKYETSLQAASSKGSE